VYIIERSEIEYEQIAKNISEVWGAEYNIIWLYLSIDADWLLSVS